MKAGAIARHLLLSSTLLMSAIIAHMAGNGSSRITGGVFMLFPLALFLAFLARNVSAQSPTFMALLAIFQLLAHMLMPFSSTTSDSRMFTSHTLAMFASARIASHCEDFLLDLVTAIKSVFPYYRGVRLKPSSRQLISYAVEVAPILQRCFYSMYSTLSPPMRFMRLS